MYLQHNCFLHISNLQNQNHPLGSTLRQKKVWLGGRVCESMRHCRAGAICNQCDILSHLPSLLYLLPFLWIASSVEFCLCNGVDVLSYSPMLVNCAASPLGMAVAAVCASQLLWLVRLQEVQPYRHSQVYVQHFVLRAPEADFSLAGPCIKEEEKSQIVGNHKHRIINTCFVKPKIIHIGQIVKYLCK